MTNDNYKPTAELRWKVVNGGAFIKSVPPMAVVPSQNGGYTWYALQQKFVSEVEGEPDEWRTVSNVA